VTNYVLYEPEIEWNGTSTISTEFEQLSIERLLAEK